MTARSWVFQTLSTDPTLTGLGFTQDSVFTTHDVDTPKVRPFMVLRWQNTVVGMSTVNQRILTVWVHDEPADYARIDTALQRVRVLLTSVAGTFTGTDGVWLSQIDWEGDSDDLDDPDVGTIMRNAQFRLTGNVT